MVQRPAQRTLHRHSTAARRCVLPSRALAHSRISSAVAFEAGARTVKRWFDHPGVALGFPEPEDVELTQREIIDEKVERVAASLALERELDIGQRIQQSFLPDRMPEVDGWTVTGLLRPARKVAGDFKAKGVIISDETIRKKMSEFHDTARAQVLAEG